jgi:hypothetical protein
VEDPASSCRDRQPTRPAVDIGGAKERPRPNGSYVPPLVQSSPLAAGEVVNWLQL